MEPMSASTGNELVHLADAAHDLVYSDSQDVRLQSLAPFLQALGPVGEEVADLLGLRLVLEQRVAEEVPDVDQADAEIIQLFPSP